VVARYGGGRLSHNTGVPGLREIEKPPKVADRLVVCLERLGYPSGSFMDWRRSSASVCS
jgi:hypothetical protein